MPPAKSDTPGTDIYGIYFPADFAIPAAANALLTSLHLAFTLE